MILFQITICFIDKTLLVIINLVFYFCLAALQYKAETSSILLLHTSLFYFLICFAIFIS